MRGSIRPEPKRLRQHARGFDRAGALGQARPRRIDRRSPQAATDARIQQKQAFEIIAIRS